MRIHQRQTLITIQKGSPLAAAPRRLREPASRVSISPKKQRAATESSAAALSIQVLLCAQGHV
jgi:hypothetical protein